MIYNPKIFLSTVVVMGLIGPGGVRAEYYEPEFSREESKKFEVGEQSPEDKYGFKYDPSGVEKELIFRQLEVITGDEETRYIIVPGDTITVSFSDRSERKGGVYQVSAEGEIYLPLIGAVKIGGLNRKEGREFLNRKLGEYIRYPAVKISVNTTGRIMIIGEIKSPGLYVMQPNLTVMESILKAGSYDEETANLKSVVLLRGGLDNPVVMRLDLNKMIKKGDRQDDVFVKPGDLIYVPKTFISNLNKFKDDVYKWVSTYYGYGRLPARPPDQPDQPTLW
jgi:polysaccharide export outer membrane protein